MATDLFGRQLQPEQPRPLTLHELQRLKRNGFPELARHLTGHQCGKCGHHTTTRFHDAACEQPLRRAEPAAEPARQPWEPRPSRRAA